MKYVDFEINIIIIITITSFHFAPSIAASAIIPQIASKCEYGEYASVCTGRNITYLRLQNCRVFGVGVANLQ